MLSKISLSLVIVVLIAYVVGARYPGMAARIGLA